MQSSETISNISKALIKFHAEVGKIVKASNNPFFKSKYASLPDILDSIREPLAHSELVIIQTPTQNNGLSTRILHSSGEWFEDTYYMQPVKNDPQSLGSSITYQRRYALGAILSLNIDDDDDGNKATGLNENNNQSQPEDNRPWLNEKQLTAIITRIKAGEIALKEQAAKEFRMKKEYKEQIQSA